jgi:hypothetical protein
MKIWENPGESWAKFRRWVMVFTGIFFMEHEWNIMELIIELYKNHWNLFISIGWMEHNGII